MNLIFRIKNSLFHCLDHGLFATYCPWFPCQHIHDRSSIFLLALSSIPTSSIFVHFFFFIYYQIACSHTFPSTPSSTLVAHTFHIHVLCSFLSPLQTSHNIWNELSQACNPHLLEGNLYKYLHVFLHIGLLDVAMKWNNKIVNLGSCGPTSFDPIYKLVQLSFYGCVLLPPQIDFLTFTYALELHFPLLLDWVNF